MPVQSSVDYKPLFLQTLRDTIPTLRLYTDDQLTKKIGKEKTEDYSKELFSYIEVGAGDNLKKVEQLALAFQVMKCLSKYITNLNLPVTLKTVLDNIGMIEYAVNQCYPGYFSCRLLKHTILPVQNA